MRRTQIPAKPPPLVRQISMPTKIESEGTKSKVIRLEATLDEIEEVFTFNPDGSLIGSEWRLKEVAPTG